MSGIAVAAVVSLSAPLHNFATPGIRRIETVNFANLMAPVTRPYVAPGKTKEYYIYGPWLDYADRVSFLGTVQTIVEKRTVGGDDGGLLRVKLTGAGERGLKTATIRIACPMIPFTDCVSGNVTFQVMVLGVGTLTRIDPDTVDANDRETFTVYGTGLDNAKVFEFRSDLTGIANQANNETWLRFDASSTACGTNRVRVRDVAEGGDFYPFPGGLDVRLTKACGYTPISSGITVGGSAPGGPDLQPVTGAPVFRHIAANRKVLSEPFCHGMFAQAVQSIVRTITVSDMIWGVKNTGGSSVSAQFRVRLLRNGVMVSEQTLNGLNAGATATFTYARPQSQTEVARLGLVPPSTTQQLYNATGGECVQTVGQASTYDWQDPTYEIRVDPLGAVTNDVNPSNNNRSF